MSRLIFGMSGMSSLMRSLMPTPGQSTVHSWVEACKGRGGCQILVSPDHHWPRSRISIRAQHHIPTKQKHRKRFQICLRPLQNSVCPHEVSFTWLRKHGLQIAKHNRIHENLWRPNIAVTACKNNKHPATWMLVTTMGAHHWQ